MSYCKQCGSKLPEEAKFCPKCGTRTILEVKSVETHRTLKVTGKPEVVVRNLALGSVEVRQGSESEVTVDLDLSPPEDFDWSISQDANAITVTCCLRSSMVWVGFPMLFHRGAPRADILVLAPKDADLKLENRAGRITVGGLKGTIVAESSAGNISIQNCEATVDVRTRVGSIDLENVNGKVSARSSAGSIKFTGALSKSDNWFRTSVGSIDITLQGQPDLVVEASTSLGSTRCIPELADARHERNRCTGRIGAGTGRLFAETRTGSITICQ